MRSVSVAFLFAGLFVSVASGVDMSWGSGTVYSLDGSTKLGAESTHSLYQIDKSAYDAISAAVADMSVGDAEEYIFNAYKNLTPYSTKAFDGGKRTIKVTNAGSSGDTVYAASIIRTTVDGVEYYRANYSSFALPAGGSAGSMSWMGTKLNVSNGASLEWREVPVQPVAKTFTWTGAAGVDKGWSDGENWDQEGEIPGEGDSVLIIGMTIPVLQSDQSVLDVIADITLQDEGAGLYTPGGEVVEIKCPIIFSGNYSHPALGREGEGLMIVKSLVDYSVKGDLELFGEVVLDAGSSVKPASKSKLLSLNGENAVVRFACSFLSAQKYYPVFRLRGDTTIGFDFKNALTQYDAAFVFGTSSTWGGCLDLNGYDQTIGSISMFPATAGGKYLTTTCLKSATPATLTITQGTVESDKAEALLWAPINGALSLKLDAAADGVLAMKNVDGCPSTTTGAVVAASGTIKLEDGTAFTRLGRLVKTGSGNIEVGNVSLGDYVELTLEGDGKVKLNNDFTVKRAKVWDAEKSDYAYLDPKTYSASDLPGHLSGTGRLVVRKGIPGDLVPLITNENWIAENAATYAGSAKATGSWSGTASAQDGGIAFNVASSHPLSFTPFTKPSHKTIREIALDMTFSAPAQDADLKAALSDGAKYGVAVVAIDEELRYVTLLNGAWVTNAFHSAKLDGSEKVVYRIDGIEDEIIYKVRSSDGIETELASASLEKASLSQVKFIGEGLIKSMDGVYYRNALGPGLLLLLK